MNKPQSLRQALTAALPIIKKNPEQLLVFIDRGQIVSTQSPNFSFEYHYTLNAILIDYAGHSDNIFVPLLVWVRENQPDLLTGQADEGMSFEAEMIDHAKTDISISLRLTEVVTVAEVDGKLVARHVDEPKLPDLSGPTDWQMFANGVEVTSVPFDAGLNGG